MLGMVARQIRNWKLLQFEGFAIGRFCNWKVLKLEGSAIRRFRGDGGWVEGERGVVGQLSRAY